MSDTHPPEMPEGTEPTAPLPVDAEPTAQIPVAPAPEAAGRGKRRTAIIATVAVLVVAVLGGGAFATWKVFFAGGPQPAEALPTSTIAILSVDLNPSAGQKIEAIKAIRKFPALRENLGLETQDDLRKFLFEKATEAAGCKDFDFEKDVEPWIGKRAAVAAVDLGDDLPVPAIAIQVTDGDKAQAGFGKVARCGDFGTDFGFAVGDDYLIASDSAKHAQQILDDGAKKPLADDAAYQRWTDEAGDQGVLNFYVAKKAAQYLADGLDELGKSFTEGLTGGIDPSSSGGGGTSVPLKTECSDDPLGAAKDQLEKFDGLAGTVRFAGGGMELSLATRGVEQLDSSAAVGDKISKLPKDTAIAAGIGIPQGYASDLFTSFKCGAGAEANDFLKDAERETGLSFPGDLETLLGSAVTLSIGGDAPAKLNELDDPSNATIGLSIDGDASKIEDLIGKVETALGFKLSDIPIHLKTSDSRIVASPSEDYAEELLKDGSLGDTANFKNAVPNADKAAGVFYVNFDSGWRETLVEFAKELGASDDDVEVADENSKPLKSFGVSSWTEGSTSHVLIKLSTD
ncbi:DUF3352 domain-containing protein [Nocardioides marmoriginsengisoli]|uniref:DUF3352 domain-containing protein n=1 Tax=Nocardioides marmoriginsengisoli TaxID=661483 RepID=A0A3N0CNI0_9ACTN|nr:DUF3352 domain-containing protein [Nocardioides marmoriginsengisoli]RNL64985.1 DUF3352 domain-containing protein [Nocardioides marmoriginsengisoli]